MVSVYNKIITAKILVYFIVTRAQLLSECDSNNEDDNRTILTKSRKGSIGKCCKLLIIIMIITIIGRES